MHNLHRFVENHPAQKGEMEKQTILLNASDNHYCLHYCKNDPTTWYHGISNATALFIIYYTGLYEIRITIDILAPAS